MDSRGAKSSVKPLTESGQPEPGRGPKARDAWHLACRAALAACVLLTLAAPVAAQHPPRLEPLPEPPPPDPLEHDPIGYVIDRQGWVR